jgi:hypothetical protein
MRVLVFQARRRCRSWLSTAPARSTTRSTICWPDSAEAVLGSPITPVSAMFFSSDVQGQVTPRCRMVLRIASPSGGLFSVAI